MSDGTRPNRRMASFVARLKKGNKLVKSTGGVDANGREVFFAVRPNGERKRQSGPGCLLDLAMWVTE